jgi:hypothetical protein
MELIQLLRRKGVLVVVILGFIVLSLLVLTTVNTIAKSNLNLVGADKLMSPNDKLCQKNNLGVNSVIYEYNRELNYDSQTGKRIPLKTSQYCKPCPKYSVPNNGVGMCQRTKGGISVPITDPYIKPCNENKGYLNEDDNCVNCEAGTAYNEQTGCKKISKVSQKKTKTSLNKYPKCKVNCKTQTKLASR